MARQAEAERERRAKVINAEGEFQAATRLAEAAQIISAHPQALQLRFLQTLSEVATENNSTILFPSQSICSRPSCAATSPPSAAVGMASCRGEPLSLTVGSIHKPGSLWGGCLCVVLGLLLLKVLDGAVDEAIGPIRADNHAVRALGSWAPHCVTACRRACGMHTSSEKSPPLRQPPGSHPAAWRPHTRHIG